MCQFYIGVTFVSVEQVIDNGEDPQEDPQGAPKMDFFQSHFIVILSNRIMLQKRIQEVHIPTHTSSLGLENLLLSHFSKQTFNFTVF